MTQERKFFVRREECWGGTYLWSVVDRESRLRVSKRFQQKAGALRMCARMEASWARYRAVSWGTGGLPSRPMVTSSGVSAERGARK